MNNKTCNVIVNDAGHVWDIIEREGSPARAAGVRHELAQDGLSVRVREVWYWIDTGEVRAADEVLMPINDLVHMVVNTTPGERHHLASVRTTVPISDQSDVQRPMKTEQGECDHKPEPYGDGQWARCNACGDGSFPVTFEASQGLEKGVANWMADDETGVELLRLLTAYQRGADRGELKGFLDVRRPI